NVQGPGSEEVQALITDDSYFRAECINATENYRIYTNPIWVELSPDDDNDGFCELVECNDNHGGTYPGAQEYCDGIDNDCDGTVDESCEGSETGVGSLDECTEAGYEQCFEFTYIEGPNTCDVSFAINDYS